jgi:hypothetical protein
MGQMFLEGLAKLKNQVIPNVQGMFLRICPTIIKEHNMNNSKKPLVEYLRSNEYRKYSYTMLDGPSPEKWDMRINANVIFFKERS